MSERSIYSIMKAKNISGMSSVVTEGNSQRRSFLKQLVGVSAASGVLGLPSLTGPGTPQADAKVVEPQNYTTRRARAFSVRLKAATLANRRPAVRQITNGDDELYPNKIGSFTKGLPHNNLGEVDLAAYNALIKALATGTKANFEAIPLGLGAKLTNPQAGLAYDLEGPDSHSLAMDPPPAISSAEAGSELAELYWMALCRDINFSDYQLDPTIAAAAAELSTFSDFKGPRDDFRVTWATLFRGNTGGDLAGPYISQFLWKSVPQGSMLIPQKLYTTVAGVDYMTDFSNWLAIQNGFKPGPYSLDPTPRYIRNLRDLGEWTHVDALYQAYHQACLILLGMYGVAGQREWYGASGAPYDQGNPYYSSSNQACFGTFCGPHVLSLVTEVASRALKACWYQKWFVHRRLRPEALAGLVHLRRTDAATYPVHDELLNAQVLDRLYNQHGSYLLPMSTAEGCPTHPSYAAGHATVAGACVTILKAWFDESTVIPNPVIPNADGTALIPYDGPDLTVGNELNKLASNVSIGRNANGFHYRSDYWDSLKLGEQVAIGILQEQAATYNEGGAWNLTKFDGTTIRI